MKNIKKGLLWVTLGLGMATIAAASPAMDKEIDAMVKENNKTMPADMGDGLMAKSMQRAGKIITLSMRFEDASLTAKDFDVTGGKKVAISQTCFSQLMRRYLDHGYTIQYHYEFPDKTRVTVPVKRSDC